MTASAKQKLSNLYVNLRRVESNPSQRRSMRVTVRQLESLIRLSEAVAKLRFSDYVTDEHVSEASRIFQESLYKIENDKTIMVGTGNDGYAMEMDEYLKIASIITDRIQECMISTPETIFTQEVIEWYLENYEHDEVPLEEKSNKLWWVIQRMIESDYILIGSGSMTDAKLQSLALHPNYEYGDPIDIPSAIARSSYPHATFSEQ